jgi:hypothetical protein
MILDPAEKFDSRSRLGADRSYRQRALVGALQP